MVYQGEIIRAGSSILRKDDEIIRVQKVRRGDPNSGLQAKVPSLEEFEEKYARHMACSPNADLSIDQIAMLMAYLYKKEGQQQENSQVPANSSEPQLQQQQPINQSRNLASMGNNTGSNNTGSGLV